MCLGKLQQPVNPHRQRLLSAAARDAKVDNKPKEAGDAKVPKKPKAKAKSQGKAKSQAKAKAPKVKDVHEVQAAAHTAYNNAKTAFMTGFLARFQDNNNQISVLYYVFFLGHEYV